MLHLVSWAVHPGTSLLRVVMNIDEGKYAFGLVLLAALNQLLHCSYLWLQNFVHHVVLGFLRARL